MPLLAEDFEGLTEPGWPRPRWLDGEGRRLPVAWITPVPNFASTDPRRRRRVKSELLCQVCGEGHDPGAEIVVFLNGGLRAVPWGEMVDHAQYKNVILRAIDDAIMHERCARLAAGSCPKLREMRAAGDLWAFAGPVEEVELYDDPEKPLQRSDAEREYLVDGVEPPEFETYLALRGRAARPFEL